jgi:UDP-N-acetylmuramoylalanine--D-glutamate ligase
MILVPNVKNKPIGVFGLGVSGLAACEALVASGAHVFAWDEDAAGREKAADTEYRAEHPKRWPWKDLVAVVVSPGVPLTHPKPHAIVRKSHMEKTPVIGDFELFARAMNAIDEASRPRVVAVTGSNGKSTTTALIGQILREAGEDVQIGGNIGAAVLSLPAPEKATIYVLELSSFQLDLAFTLRANAAVFLNLSPDHIDRHGSTAGYLAAKKRIFRNQKEMDAAIVGVDDSYGESLCTELTASGAAQVFPVSAQGALGRGAYALDGKLFYNFDGKTFLAGDLSGARALRGPHNQQNAAAALAACAYLGVSPALVVKTAQRFAGLPHRMEEVARMGKTVFINDSKATNAAAAGRALSAVRNIYWIAGGRSKEGGASSLRELMGHVARAYFIGEAALEFEEQLRGAVPCVQCGDLATAFARASADAAADDKASATVLLSPACASYDQFKNFEERGDVFRQLASDLATANGEAA